MKGLFLTVLTIGVVLGILSSISTWVPVVFLLVGTVVMANYLLTRPRSARVSSRPQSTHISIRTAGNVSSIDISIGDQPRKIERSVCDQPPMQYSRPLCICGAEAKRPMIMPHTAWCKAHWPGQRRCQNCDYELLTSADGELHKRVLSRLCPNHAAQFADPGTLPVVDAADPQAVITTPIYNDIPGVIGYVQRNGQLEPIMDPDFRGTPSIFPKRPGGAVDQFPGPYAPTSDVVRWGEKQAERDFRRQQRLDRYDE
jgi:hypothetical protein